MLLLVLLGACLADKAPRAGRPDAALLATQQGVSQPLPARPLCLPRIDPARTGRWDWPPSAPGAACLGPDPARPGRARRSAWVLSGGGVRGAFQAGLLTRVFADPSFAAHWRTDHIYGVSVGALNGILAGLSEGARQSPACPGCTGAGSGRYGLPAPGPYLLWSTWAGIPDYRWFQTKRSMVALAVDGYLFDLRTLRLRLDQLLGAGDTLFVRGPAPPAEALARLCTEGGLGWPVLHVGYVPYDTGLYRSVAYDPRREAELFCADHLPGLLSRRAPTPESPITAQMDGRARRATARAACARGESQTGHPLGCAVLDWVEASCPRPEDGPGGCARDGAGACCTDDFDAFKDATWASAAQPLLHNPVPLDGTADGFQARVETAGPRRDPARARAADAARRAGAWGGAAQRRQGLKSHPDAGGGAWRDRAAAPRRSFAALQQAAGSGAGVSWAIDGGVREVFPLLEALVSGVDDVIVVGNVPQVRPRCLPEFSRDLPGPGARTYTLLMRSILEQTISEVYNDDLLIGRNLLQDLGLWNIEKRAAADLMAAVVSNPEGLGARCAADPAAQSARALLAAELELMRGPCAAQTRADPALATLAEAGFCCDAASVGGDPSGACRVAASLRSTPRTGHEGWRSWPQVLQRLQDVQAPDTRACLAGHAADLSPFFPDAAALQAQARPAYLRVPNVYLALPDRTPGDPLDQVHEDLMVMMRDGWHRADHLIPLLDYSPPDRCVSDPVCASCGVHR